MAKEVLRALTIVGLNKDFLNISFPDRFLKIDIYTFSCTRILVQVFKNLKLFLQVVAL
jgi:hypothetical protein